MSTWSHTQSADGRPDRQTRTTGRENSGAYFTYDEVGSVSAVVGPLGRAS